MEFSLTPEQVELQARIHVFCKEHLNTGIVERDHKQQFSRTLWELCGREGLQGLAIDKTFGGTGLEPLSTMLGIEALGFACRDNGLSFAIAAHLFSCAIPLQIFGTESQKIKFLPSSCNGKFIAANAITEAQSGSDALHLSTKVENKENTYSLSGEKVFCTSLPEADWVLVYAKSNENHGLMNGLTAFILEKGIHDFSCPHIYTKMGLRTCLMGKLSMDNTVVNENNILGREGNGGVIFNYSMNWERIGMAALHLGTMTRLLEEFITFVKHRKVGRKAMKDFQAVQHKIAQLSTELEATRLLVYKAAALLNKPNRVHQYAAMAKLAVSELYKNGTMDLLHLYGAQGYVDNHEIERMARDAAASTLYSGTSEIQKNIIAKWKGL